MVPGEVVTLTGDAAGTFTIPADAKPGLRIWHQVGDQWIDFTVVPLADARVFVASSTPGTITVELLPHVPLPVVAAIRVGQHSEQHRLEPQSPLTMTIPLAADRTEGVRDLNLQVDAGSLRMQRTFREKTERVLIPVAA